MTERRSSTSLPQIRRSKRRDWGRVVARILCVLFAVCGLVPVALGLVVRTSWARAIATAETRKIVSGLGVDAHYVLELKMWPLSVGLRNLRVEATDGGSPFLTAKRVTARPKIFGLLAGKLVIDQVEIEQPAARVVLKDGKLQNLGLDLPKSEKKTEEPQKTPFSVISASEGQLDLLVDGVHLKAKDIDADVTADVDGEENPVFEVALRLSEARGKMVRTLKNGDFAVDDDVLCRVDGRARVEKKKIVVRRLDAHGAVDFDPAEDTSPGCGLSKDDKRYVEVSLGHLTVGLPQTKEDLPTFDGHVKLRAPIPIVDRMPDTPDVDGWIAVDAELRYSAETPLPDMAGHLDAGGVRVDRYSFARSIHSDFVVRRSIVSAPLTRVEIGDGVAELRDAEIHPLEKGIPIKLAKLDVADVNFTSLLHDLSVARKPHVRWDLKEVHASGIHGTGNPLHLDGEMNAKTQNFAVYDAPVEDANKVRAIGLSTAEIRGHLAIRPEALQFQDTTVILPHGMGTGVLVSLGFASILKVEVPSLTVDLDDISPLGNVAMGGIAHAKATIAGHFSDPHVDGQVEIQGYTLGQKPNEIVFGNVTQGHVLVPHIAEKTVILQDVRAQKGKSNYELPTGRLEFGGEAAMRFDGQALAKGFDLRDFFTIFKLDEDPSLAELGATFDGNARVHLTLGGPEDRCKGGYLDVQASVNARDLNLLGERFDDGHADLEYRWIDSKAGLDGAEIDVRSMSLGKIKRDGRTTGSVLGAVTIHPGGAMRGSLVVQGFPLGKTDLLGAFASKTEGSISGVASIGGTVEAYDIQADLDVTPVRLFGAPFGSSSLHVGMTQLSTPTKVVGKTACGAEIHAPFDKEAYLHDTSVQGAYRIDGTLFGEQAKLDGVEITRQKQPVLKGKIDLRGLDLGPIGQVILPPAPGEVLDPESALGGEISGVVDIGRLAFSDVSHASATFTPRSMRIARGGQRLELRPPKDAQAVTLANDNLAFPVMTFDLAAPNGLKGAVTVKGGIGKVTHGADLDLDAQLTPIDLGILVGVVPRVTRATGTLTGSMKVGGKLASPAFDGKLAVRSGELTAKGLPSGITDIEVDVEADENEAKVTRAFGRFMGGTVGITGHMPLKGGQLGVMEAAVTGRGLSVSPMDGLKSTVDADLTVSVNPMATTPVGRLPFVGGDVTITSFEYTRPITIDPLNGLKGGAKRTVVEAYDPTQDALAFGFDVRSRVPLRIRNNIVDAQLAIDPAGIHVSGTNQRIGLRGELNTMAGGRFRLFANDFEVQKGTITFDDPTRIVPRIDITARTEYRRYTNTVSSSAPGGTPAAGTADTSAGIAGTGQGGTLWRITVHAFGDADDWRLDMTSDPPLSREDIALLLTIGLTRAEVDQVRAGSVYASAAFEALGTVSGVDRAVKQAIPVIDDFRPGTAYSSATGRVEPNITVGRRLTESLRARVTSALAEDPQLRSTIEWRLNRSVTVEPSYDRINTTSSSNVGNFGVDLRWRLEFD